MNSGDPASDSKPELIIDNAVKIGVYLLKNSQNHEAVIKQFQNLSRVVQHVQIYEGA